MGQAPQRQIQAMQRFETRSATKSPEVGESGTHCASNLRGDRNASMAQFVTHGQTASRQPHQIMMVEGARHIRLNDMEIGGDVEIPRGEQAGIVDMIDFPDLGGGSLANGR